MRSLSALALALVLLPATIFAANASVTDPMETNLQIIAAAVRAQGLPCDHPQETERDIQASQAERSAWLLRCVEGRYRVIYEGDTGPQVMPLQ